MKVGLFLKLFLILGLSLKIDYTPQKPKHKNTFLFPHCKLIPFVIKFLLNIDISHFIILETTRH